MRIASLIAAAALCGCSSLLITPEDSTSTSAVKLTTRTALGLATLGAFEVAMWDAKRQRSERDRPLHVRNSWNRRLGRYALDDAVRELGPPTAIRNQGDWQVASWRQSRAGSVPVPLSGQGIAAVQAPIAHGTELALFFDADTGELISVDYTEW